MSELQDKLKALLSNKGVMTGAQWSRQRSELEERRATGEFEIDRIVPGSVVGEDQDGFYLVRHEVPLETHHGNREIGDVLNVVGEHISLSASDTELVDFDPTKAIFVDTETTGLSGGTGTVSFLVGAGYFTGNGFRIDQCFMRDFDDEEPMLRYLAGLFEERETIVSYNGKSFDVPLLRTRFISNRVPFRLDASLHFDLVHATRRFFKARLGDCSLGNVEKVLLDIRRQGDVSSGDIPRIWLDYLHTRDARKLKQVFYHHKMDILSLVTLTALLSESIDVPEGAGFEHPQDRLSLVRVHFMQKRYKDVLDLGQAFLEENSDAILRRACFEMIGFAAKRLQQWERMEDAWNGLLEETPKDLVALNELAKHMEHRRRNLPRALELCKNAIDIIENRATLQRDPGDPTGLRDFQHRHDRLVRKLRPKGNGQVILE